MNTDQEKIANTAIRVHPVTSRERDPTSVVPLVPRADVSIRVATMADLPFMDRMQKMHSKQLGYFPTKQFEDYIEQGAVLIAEEGAGFRVQGSGETGASSSSSLNPEPRTLNPLGYCI